MRTTGALENPNPAAAHRCPRAARHPKAFKKRKNPARYLTSNIDETKAHDFSPALPTVGIVRFSGLVTQSGRHALQVALAFFFGNCMTWHVVRQGFVNARTRTEARDVVDSKGRFVTVRAVGERTSVSVSERQIVRTTHTVTFNGAAGAASPSLGFLTVNSKYNERIETLRG